jgi:predicted phosphohydrolase
LVTPTLLHQVPPCTTKGILLAGDIGDPFKPNYHSFLELCAGTFKNVFLTTGNHEYDKQPKPIIEEHVEKITECFDNVHYLQNTVAVMEDELDTVMFGSTLWSERVKQSWHLDAKQSLMSAIADARHEERHIVVMTHYLPTRQLIEPRFIKYQNHHNFYSHLDNLIASPVICWICGHSHSIQTKKINDVFLGMNCVGYRKPPSPVELQLQYFKLN